MLQHVAAGDAVERAVGKRQPRQIGHDEPRPVALQPVSRPAEHLVRQIEAGDVGLRVGILDEMLGDLARPAADVQDAAGRRGGRTSARGTAGRPAACAARSCCTWPAAPPAARRTRPGPSPGTPRNSPADQPVLQEPVEHRFRPLGGAREVALRAGGTRRSVRLRRPWSHSGASDDAAIVSG